MTPPTLEGLIAYHEATAADYYEQSRTHTHLGAGWRQLDGKRELHKSFATLLRSLSAPQEGLVEELNEAAGILEIAAASIQLNTLPPTAPKSPSEFWKQVAPYGKVAMMQKDAALMRRASAALTTKTEDEKVGVFVKERTHKEGYSLMIQRLNGIVFIEGIAFNSSKLSNLGCAPTLSEAVRKAMGTG